MKFQQIACGSVLVVSLVGCSGPDAGSVLSHASQALQPAAGATIVLRGTLLTPQGVVDPGYVTVGGGRILAISAERPELPDAVQVNTHGIIAPGFVDVHNHVPWNVLPRWKPTQRFADRYQWQVDPDFRAKVQTVFDRLDDGDSASGSICDMNTWGELRALVGGATSVLATHAVPCIHGLVRNLDYNSGFYGSTELDRERIVNVIGLPLASDPFGRAQFVGLARFAIGNPFFEGLVIHLAEGVDAASEEEFTFMRSQRLLTPKGVVVHGISLNSDDFQAMAAAGTALVWSPRSNIELYGQTANVTAALDAGVEVALAPDWAISGSSNMLDELRYAADWNRTELAGSLSDKQLFEMVTSIPARITGIDDEVGSIQVGLRADLVVIDGKSKDPYASVVAASATDVELVMIDGVPLYGERTLLNRFWDRAGLEALPVPGGDKALATSAAGVVVGDVADRLRSALTAAGSSLADLSEAP